MSRTQYLNKERRINVFWVSGFMTLLEGIQCNYKGKSATWIRSMIISMEAFLNCELQGIDDKERRTIINLIDQFEPRLVPRNNLTKAETVQADPEDIWDLAEYAMEYCERCPGNFDECRLRELSLRLSIPPLVENGPCQYWRENCRLDTAATVPDKLRLAK